MDHVRLSDSLVEWFQTTYRERDGSIVDRCSCQHVDEQWKGGEHLVSTVPGTPAKVHFYPDEMTRTIVVLLIEGK